MWLTQAWGRASVPSIAKGLAGSTALYSFGMRVMPLLKEEEKHCPYLLVLWSHKTYYGSSQSGEGISAGFFHSVELIGEN